MSETTQATKVLGKAAYSGTKHTAATLGRFANKHKWVPALGVGYVAGGDAAYTNIQNKGREPDKHPLSGGLYD